MSPFPYHQWRRIRAADVEVVRRGLWLARALAPHVADALGKVGAALGVPLKLRLAGSRRTTAALAAGATSDPCAIVRIGVRGFDAPILAEVDLGLAFLLVDRALGGTVGEFGALRRPNAAERAVLALLVARVLSAAQTCLPAIRVLGVAADPAAVGTALGGDDRPVHVFELAFWGEGAVGLVRVLVPEALVARAPPPASVAPTPASLSRLDALGLRAGLRAIAGRTHLAAKDLAGVEPGDVVLCDEATARPGKGGVVGRIGLRLPRGRRPRFLCRLDAARLIVEDVDRTEETSMQGIAKGSVGDAGALLSEIPVEVVIEVGRVEVSAREVVEIGVGDTLVLDRRPGDPVELRAGDRLLGRGELVDVDGKIGVHVLEVVR